MPCSRGNWTVLADGGEHTRVPVCVHTGTRVCRWAGTPVYRQGCEQVCLVSVAAATLPRMEPMDYVNIATTLWSRSP